MMNDDLTNASPMILAIDTATGGCSVALCRGTGTLAMENEAMTKGHAEALAPMVARVLKTAGATPEDLDAIAVTHGPGAFTGLRIGLSMARAMALALGVPGIGVTTLEAVAAGASEGTHGLVVCIESRREDVYAQLFSADGAPASEPEACDGARLKELYGAQSTAQLLAGDAAVRTHEMLAGVGVDAALSPAPALPDPVVIAAIARARLKLGERSVAPEPLYLRAPDAKLPKSGGRARP